MEQPNLSYVMSLSGGDKEFEKKLIQIIKSEFPGELKTYKYNIEHKNYLKASEEMIDSNWHKQTTKRCESLASIMRNANK